jgi:hypothetical protein
MMDWIVYYDDGSSFTSDDGPPEAAPRDGVQVVSGRHAYIGKLIWHSSDYYCWQDDEWVPRNIVGLHDYLRQPGSEKIVLQGRGVAYHRFVAVYNKAVDDTRLPFKVGRDLREPEPPTP